MNIEFHKWWSDSLQREMALKVYGHAGKPVMVFPAERGSFYEFEDFGMIKALSEFINSGRIKVFTVDSVDAHSWCNYAVHPSERVRYYNRYDNYIINEVVPFIRSHTGNSHDKMLSTGCSMGGYHSANFFFRHPDIFDSLVAMSGVYRLKLFIGEYMDSEVYFHTPLAYLSNLNDPKILEQYRNSRIIISVGQGRWEEDMIEDARSLKGILEAKSIPAWVDFWGYDVDHDWEWWRVQAPYFFSKVV